MMQEFVWMAIGATVVIMVAAIHRKLGRRLVRRATLVSRFWFFTIPFALAVIAIYSFIFVRLPRESIQPYLTVVGASATLVFAIYVGYLSFRQVAESRAEKLIEIARTYRAQELFGRAREALESAHSASPTNQVVLSDLLELLLIQGDYDRFDSHIPRLSDLAVEAHERVHPHMLTAMRYLLVQDLGRARDALLAAVKPMRTCRSKGHTSGWSFSDIHHAESYKKLSGDFRKIFDNLELYFSSRLPEDKITRFEGGEFAC